VRAGRLQRTPSLIRPDLCVASDGWAQIAQRICFAFLEFSVALVNLQILRPNRLMADRTHLSCFTISTASCNRLRYAREHKRERDGSNGNTMRQPSLGAWLRHHGFLFNSHEYQLHGGRTVPENSGAFWEEDRATGTQPPTRPHGGGEAPLCRAPGLSPRSDPPRPRGRPTI
jgi:hypothetical protein